VWVGPKSKIPNIDGIRKDLVDQMRKIKAPRRSATREDCFADSYDWRDGIGPSEKTPAAHEFLDGRQKMTNRRPSLNMTDPTNSATNEFVHFCKLIGAEPYLAANVSQPARFGILPVGGVLQFSGGQHHAC